MLISNRSFLWQLYDIVIRAKRRTSTKFQQDSFKTERLVCIETDGQTDGQTDGHGYIDSACRPIQ